jgi:uncharacterized RDD family membrane protein YckC
MEVFVLRDQQRTGPFSSPRLREMWEEGALTPDTLVWHEGLASWRAVRDVEAVMSVVTPDPLAATEPPRERPAALEEPSAKRTSLLVRRSIARQIDSILILLVTASVGVKFGWLDPWNILIYPTFAVLLSSAALWIPLEAFLLSRFATTPGRWLLGLHVVDAQTNRVLPWPRALQRSIGVWFLGFGIGLPIGTIVPIFQAGLAWHHVRTTGRTIWDRASDARVVGQRLGAQRILILITLLYAIMSLTQWIVANVPPPDRFPAELRRIIEQLRRPRSGPSGTPSSTSSPIGYDI